MQPLHQHFFFSFLLIGLLTFAGTACKKKDDPAPSVNGTGGTTYTGKISFFRAKIDSDSINYTEDKGGYEAYNGAARSTYAPDNWIVYSASLGVLHTSSKMISVSLGNVHLVGETQCTKEQFYALYSTGSFSYSPTEDQQTFEGVSLYWQDDNGDSWTTTDGQTGSTFTVTKITKIAPSFLSEAQVEVEATLNCKLYNYDDHTLTKTLKNGKMKLRFLNM